MSKNNRQPAAPDDIQSILEESQVIHVALSDHGIPYVVPMCYGYDGKHIYLHSAPSGRKMEILERHNIVCFNCVSAFQAVPGAQPCSWSMQYRSVTGTGRARLVTESAEKRTALECIARHYSPEETSFDDASMDHVSVICIHIEQTSCRIRQPDAIS